jgi:protein-S-isoprenylcysteine O-methyltransferase Ste14
MEIDLVWLALVWILYYSVHSLLLLPSIKASLQKTGLSDAAYRLAYTLISIIGLVLVLGYYRSLPKPTLMTEESELVRIMAMVLMGGGVYLLWKSLATMSLAEFIGLRSASKPTLHTEGLYELVRHPMYFSILLILFGGLMYAPSYAYLLSASLTIVYIYVGATLEEKRLLQQFGKKYEQYRAKTPMLIPFTSF